MKAELYIDLPKSKLAEAPVWDHRDNTLWWVDVLSGNLHSFNHENGKSKTYSIGQYIGAAINVYMQSEENRLSTTTNNFLTSKFTTNRDEYFSIPLAQIDLSRTADGESVLKLNPGYAGAE